MMIIHNVEQGSSRWAMLRAGIPTASEFHRILTPSGKISESAEDYMFALLAERIIGRPLMTYSSEWMTRGSYLEPEAVAFYEFQRDLQTVKVGFITTDDGLIGASPDRLVGDEGLLETKCPAPGTHVGYLVGGSPDKKYFSQLQGQLWVSQRRWVDILSYHPEMPPAIVRVQRNEEFIKSLSAAVQAFSHALEKWAKELEDKGWLKPIRFETMALP